MLNAKEAVRRKINLRSIVLFVGAAILIILAAFIIADSQEYFRASGSDFFSLWLAPHLLVEGKDPYKPDDWVPAHALYGAKWVSDPTFLYPLPLAIILLPLGLLPLDYAAVLWLVMAILAILITCRVILSIWHIQWPISFIIPILVGIFLFRPVAESLRLGQIDWLILLCLAGGYYFWDKQKWLAGGIVMGLTVIKPQIGVPLLVFLSLWLFIRRLWSGMIGEGIVTAGLFAIGWIINSSWLSEWLNNALNKPTYNYCCTPTLWGLASLMCKFNQNCGFTLGTVLAIILCLILFYILFPIPIGLAKFVLSLSIPIALLVSPYLWTYSQVILVIPILLILAILNRKQYPYLLTAAFPIYISLFTALIVYVSIKIGVDVLSSLVPISIFILVVLLYRLYYNRGGISTEDCPSEIQ